MEAVGRLYGLVGRCQGKVLEGDVAAGSTSWSVTTLVPAPECANLAAELRKWVCILNEWWLFLGGFKMGKSM